MSSSSDLTPVEHLFALEYLKDFNMARAAADAGLKAKNLYNAGYTVYKRANVQNFMAIEIAKRNQMAFVDARYVLNRLVEVIEVDLVEWALAGQSGVAEDRLKEMPKDIRKLVTGIERNDTYNNKTGEKTTTFKFKMMDKTKCLEMLGKYLGLFDKRVQIDANVTHNYVEWAAEMRKKRNEHIINVTPRTKK